MISVITCHKDTDLSYVKECAESVSRQDGFLEWVFVDDGSASSHAADVRRVVNGLSDKLPTKFISLPYTVGLSAARNLAFSLARGSIFYVLDADDRMPPGIATRLNSEPTSAQLFCVESNFFGEEGNEHRKIDTFSSLFEKHAGQFMDPFLWFDFYYHGLIARRSLVEMVNGYSYHLRVGEDQDILFRCVEAVEKSAVVFLNSIGYEYRNNPKGVCRVRTEMVFAGYISSMVAAARRRGVQATDARFSGTRQIDGGTVDVYEYCVANVWHTWESATVEFSRSNDNTRKN